MGFNLWTITRWGCGQWFVSLRRFLKAARFSSGVAVIVDRLDYAIKLTPHLIFVRALDATRPLR